MTDIKIWDSVGLCLQREFMQSHSNQNGTLAGHHNQPAGPATERKIMKRNIKNNDLTHYFIRDHRELPASYLKSCQKFFDEIQASSFKLQATSLPQSGDTITKTERKK